MNYTEIFFSAANTILLIVLFLYQRNRNKVLEDQLGAQRELLDETKSVVLQQASAIEGQGKVVDSALKYTAAFDPKKLEEVIRREVTLEHREQIEQAQRDANGAASSRSADLNELTDKVINVAVRAASEAAVDIIKPLLPLVFQAVLRMPEGERSGALVEIPPDMRHFLLTAARELENRVQAGLLHASS